MSKIVKKYIGTAQVGGVQIRLENNQSLVSRNAADSADVQLLKLDAGDLLQALLPIYLPGNASAALQATPRQQVLLLDGSQAMESDLNMDDFKITNVFNPTNPQDVATKDYVDNAIPVITGKANINLDNLDTTTSIPATTVSLRSLNTSQVFATEFKVETSVQTTSNSGSVRLNSGNVEGDFLSGGARVGSGFSTNATRATAATAATGQAAISSGSITGGTQGSTGSVFVTSGAISNPAAILGNTGTIIMTSGSINSLSTGTTGETQIFSGINNGVGASGRIILETGNSTNAAGGNSGAIFMDTGRSLNGVSGTIGIFSGDISNVNRFPGDLNNITSVQPTGAVTLRSGNIFNASSAADTGILTINTGINAGAGSSGALTVSTGENTGTGASGSLNLNTGASAASNSGAVNIASGTAGGASTSGQVNISSGATSAAGASGNVILSSGATAAATSGIVTVITGSAVGAFPTGALNLFSGNNTNASFAGPAFTATGAVLVGSGDVEAGTGASGSAGVTTGLVFVGATGNTGAAFVVSGRVQGTGRTGDIEIGSGENTGTGDSGDVYIFTGDVASGTAGKISLFGRIVEVESEMDMQANKIIDLADPTNPQDAATKSYVDAQVSAGVTSAFERIVLNATDITNQYVDLSDKYVVGTIDVSSSRVVLNVSDISDVNYDFQGDNTGLVTRLLFQGPSATGGGEELVDGDVLFVKGILA